MTSERLPSRTTDTPPDLPFDLGCPVWACAGWEGEVYPAKTPRHEWLSWYSRTFNAIEGNSTFYGLPSRETLERWCETAAEGFRFCLKIPQEISHQARLAHVEAPVTDFFEVLKCIDGFGKLGTTFLQLPPNFSPQEWAALECFLRKLPRDWSWAVELRHHDWFDQGLWESRLDDMLGELQIDKVLFDTRVLFSGETTEASELEARRRKPRVPLRTTATGQRPFLRFVGRNDMGPFQRVVDELAETTANWILEGRRPQVFTHAPDDRYAPAFARQFAAAVGMRLGGKPFELPRPPQTPEQLSLF